MKPYGIQLDDDQFLAARYHAICLCHSRLVGVVAKWLMNSIAGETSSHEAKSQRAAYREYTRVP